MLVEGWKGGEDQMESFLENNPLFLFFFCQTMEKDSLPVIKITRISITQDLKA